MFSAFPPLMLQFPARKVVRRQRIRAILWFLVIAFVITLTTFYYQIFGSKDQTIDNGLYYHSNQAWWLGYCQSNN